MELVTMSQKYMTKIDFFVGVYTWELLDTIKC